MATAALAADRRRTSAGTSTGPPALPDLRQRRRRQVHADRPAALTTPGLSSRTSLRRCAARARRPSARRRRYRLLAPGRRPEGRARARHHHRRRLPLFRHRQAQVHRRRYARAMSSTRATWRPAPRPPTLAVMLVDASKGVLDADPPPRLHPRCSASARRPRREQDGSRRLSTRAASTSIVGGLRRASPRGSASSDSRRIPVSARSRRQRRARGARDTPWYDGPTLAATSSSLSRSAPTTGDQPFRLPVQWVNRPNADFPRLCRPVASGVVRRGDR